MSVLDRSYHRWQGEPTTYFERVLVVPRYALADLLRRRVVVALWIVALVPPLALAVLTYFAANVATFAEAMPWLREVPMKELMGATTFGIFTKIQLQLCVVLALFAAPALLARDMSSGALPLFLSKALRRRDYVLGKCAVVFALFSSVSWVPLLLVVGLRSALSLPPVEGVSLALAVLVAPLVFVTFLTVLTCAVSAHVRRTWLAPFVLLGVLFTTGAMGATMNAFTGTRVGTVVSPMMLNASVHRAVFTDPQAPARREDAGERSVPVPVALAGLAAWTTGCGLLLARRVRAVEVVR